MKQPPSWLLPLDHPDRLAANEKQLREQKLREELAKQHGRNIRPKETP